MTPRLAEEAISKRTKGIAIAVSQSSGSVRLFQNGEMVLHIEPVAPRPLTWGALRMEQDSGPRDGTMSGSYGRQPAGRLHQPGA